MGSERLQAGLVDIEFSKARHYFEGSRAFCLVVTIADYTSLLLRRMGGAVAPKWSGTVLNGVASPSGENHGWFS